MRRALLAVSMLASLLVASGVGPAPTVAALPAGFVDTVVADIPGVPTTVEALPDGRVVVLSQDGRVTLVDDRDGTAATRQLADFNDICSTFEKGLLGLALDPDYVVSGTVYVYRTVVSGQPGGCHNRVSRFTMNDTTLDLGSEVVLVDNISAVNGNHNGGDLEVGHDGFLYIAVGDAGSDPRGNSGSGGSNDAARDLSLLNGKILRVDRFTGVAAPGNPFSGGGTADCRLRGNTSSTPTTTCREIFASGLRNPYRFAFDPNTGDTRFFINDVGQNTREEVNEGVLGADYGWNLREGQCPRGDNPPCAGPPAGLTDPITDYSHSIGDFITAGAFIPNGHWPAEYDGGYLFADGGEGQVWLRRADGSVDYGDEFLTGKFGIVDMAFSVGGLQPALYYVSTGGQLARVTGPTSPTIGDTGRLVFQPLDTIERRFDSREDDGGTRIRGGQTRLIDLDAPDDAVAVLANVTLVRPLDDSGFATAWLQRTHRPNISNVNARLGEAVGNLSIIPLQSAIDAVGGGGDPQMLLFSQASSHLTVDVAGFFVSGPGGAATAGRIVTADSPSRLIDTREPASIDRPYDRAVDGAGQRVTVPVVGVDASDVPAGVDEATAVVVVITAITNEGAAGGFVTPYPTGSARPVVSSVNVGPEDVRANMGVVQIGDDGSIELYLEGVDHVVVDLLGHVTGSAATAATEGLFHLITPARDADSRIGDSLDRLTVGVPAMLNPEAIFDGAGAVAQNVTMVRTGGRGFVTSYPGPTQPDTSSVNASAAGQVRGAFNITTMNAGSVSYVAGESPTDLTIDVFGYFES
ncbi:MAG: PQQ-dependent sugar dehydrogenase [Actinomycetota bacterium]